MPTKLKRTLKTVETSLYQVVDYGCKKYENITKRKNIEFFFSPIDKHTSNINFIQVALIFFLTYIVNGKGDI